MNNKCKSLVPDITKKWEEMLYLEANESPEYLRFRDKNIIQLNDIQGLFQCGEWKMPSALDVILQDSASSFEGVKKLLLKNGWKPYKYSCRILYKKDDKILKMAVDANGILQNFAEAHYQESIRLINQDINKPKKLKIQPILFSHPKYYWVIQEYVEGNEPSFNTDIMKRFERYLYKWDIDDVWSKNFIYFSQDKKYYLVDYGFANIKRYELYDYY